MMQAVPGGTDWGMGQEERRYYYCGDTRYKGYIPLHGFVVPRQSDRPDSSVVINKSERTSPSLLRTAIRHPGECLSSPLLLDDFPCGFREVTIRAPDSRRARSIQRFNWSVNLCECDLDG